MGFRVVRYRGDDRSSTSVVLLLRQDTHNLPLSWTRNRFRGSGIVRSGVDTRRNNDTNGGGRRRRRQGQRWTWRPRSSRSRVNFHVGHDPFFPESTRPDSGYYPSSLKYLTHLRHHHTRRHMCVDGRTFGSFYEHLGTYNLTRTLYTL